MYSAEDAGLGNLHIHDHQRLQQQSSQQERLLQLQPQHQQNVSVAQAQQSDVYQADALPDKHKALYQCGRCKRRFTRADHLNRHVRTHTAEKPFVCSVCNKAFARADLLKRHSIQHASRDTPANSQPNGQDALGKTRVTQACRACITSKVKCDEQKPCQRCTRKQITCEDPVKDSNVSPESQHTSNGSQSDIPVIPGGWQPHPQVVDQYQTPVHDQLRMGVPMLPHDVPHPAQMIMEGQHLAQHEHGYADFLRDLMSSPSSISVPDQHMLDSDDGSRQGHGQIDHTFADWNISSFSYSEEDFLALDVPMENVAPDGEEDPGGDTPFAAVAQAFKQSIWYWIPASTESRNCEQDNLALPANGLEQARAMQPNGRPSVDQQVQQGDRDRVLFVVLNTCQKPNIPKIVSNFPSSHLLELMLQVFLQCHIIQNDSFIHVPTFQTNTARPELLIAMIAAGGVLTSVKSLQKMGFAFQEVVRTACGEKFDSDNSTTRDLQMLQSFELFLSIGFWSGSKRKVEISEAFQSNTGTMLRRSGKFRHSSYKTILPYATDEGEVLESKWRRWVEQESFKRLVYHLFIMSSQTSITLQINPLISFSELTLPLPEQTSLWTAGSALEWKELYMKTQLHASGPPPSLLDCTRTILGQGSSPFLTGTNYYSRLTLYSLWEFVMEHRRLQTVFSSCNISNTAATVLQPFQHQSLVATLASFSFSFSTNNPHLNPTSTNEIALLAELLLLILHTPLYNLLLFAGKEGEEEARRAYFHLKSWVHTREARQSLWHAGQLLKAARLLRRDLLRDFYAIVVYYASLALWTYGMIASEKPAAQEWTEVDQSLVQLDGEDSMEVHRFISLGVGNPGIGKIVAGVPRGPEDHREPMVLLIDPGAVMDVSIGVLSGEMWSTEDSDHDMLPPLVQNVLQLMEETRKAARYIYKN